MKRCPMELMSNKLAVQKSTVRAFNCSNLKLVNPMTLKSQWAMARDILPSFPPSPSCLPLHFFPLPLLQSLPLLSFAIGIE